MAQFGVANQQLDVPHLRLATQHGLHCISVSKLRPCCRCHAPRPDRFGIGARDRLPATDCLPGTTGCAPLTRWLVRHGHCSNEGRSRGPAAPPSESRPSLVGAGAFSGDLPERFTTQRNDPAPASEWHVYVSSLLTAITPVGYARARARARRATTRAPSARPRVNRARTSDSAPR